jgi:hypothetical protein
MDLIDFPPIVHQAFDLHGQLGDRYATTDLGLLYIGKDYSTLPIMFKYAQIPDEDEEFLLKLIQRIDAKAIKKSSANIQAAANKLKTKKVV